MPDLTITLTNPMVNRAQVMVGHRRNLGRDANLAECKQYVAEWLRGEVLSDEMAVASAAAALTASNNTFTTT